MNSLPELIKERLNILDVVSPYVELKKAGKSYKGKSPFNVEKTPSFFVHPDKGFFYDFSAGFGGDIFTFIQKIERVDFPEALRILAERAGVSLDERQSSSEYNERARLLALHEDLTNWYHEQLMKNTDALDYLHSRGLTDGTITHFRLGFAPKEWGSAVSFLTTRGYSKEEIVKSGVGGEKKDGTLFDRFRSRILFPLFDTQGRVVAFSGRIFQDDHPAKYLNSPETILFEKSKILYPYHLAKSSFSKNDLAILVEGQFDVVLSHQAGYENTVAVSGTGLSEEQLSLIARFTKRIALALDADRAGIRAARRAVKMAYARDFDVSLIILSEGEDPADTILRSKEKWDLLVKEAVDYIDFEIQGALRHKLDFSQKLKLLQEEIFPILAVMKSALKREHAIGRLAHFLGMSKESVADDFRHYLGTAGPLTQESSSFELPQTSSTTVRESSRNIPVEEERRDTEREVKLFIYALSQKDPLAIEKDEELRSLAERVFSGESIETLTASPPEEEKEMILFVVEEEEMTTKYVRKKIFDSLVFLRILQLEKRAKEIDEEIKRLSVRTPDRVPVELMRESQEVLSELTTLRAK